MQFHLRAAWKYEHERDCAYIRIKNHAACGLRAAVWVKLWRRPQLRPQNRPRHFAYIRALNHNYRFTFVEHYWYFNIVQFHYTVSLSQYISLYSTVCTAILLLTILLTGDILSVDILLAIFFPWIVQSICKVHTHTVYCHSFITYW